jgi:hypothetical protein
MTILEGQNGKLSRRFKVKVFREYDVNMTGIAETRMDKGFPAIAQFAIQSPRFQDLSQ